MQKQYTIELDEMTCKWLQHISELTGKTAEELIANRISNQLIALEDEISQAFLEQKE